MNIKKSEFPRIKITLNKANKDFENWVNKVRPGDEGLPIMIPAVNIECDKIEDAETLLAAAMTSDPAFGMLVVGAVQKITEFLDNVKPLNDHNPN